MLLSITTTYSPATDIGYLLHKNPNKYQTFQLAFGHAHIFYPQASPEKCTAVLIVDIDPIEIIRSRRSEERILQHYVNDRPFVASSLLAVAIKKVYRTAMNGNCKERPELTTQKLPLEVKIAVVCCKEQDILYQLFEPLGYKIKTKHHLLDEKFPQWGKSPYHTVILSGNFTLKELLTHLYVLIPVMDDDKHYWIDEDEIQKLLAHGEGWLHDHPHYELIVHRYLKRQHNLTRQALQRLTDTDIDKIDKQQRQEESIEKPLKLNQQRLNSVLAVIDKCEANTAIDLGCGEGKLLKELLRKNSIYKIVGMDVSYRALQRAKEKLHLDEMFEKQKQRIDLIQGSLMYRDRRLEGFDVATVIEVIEHLDTPRLRAFERVVFEFARPKTVIITTPNSEYNAKFAILPAGKFRHPDHRFEWTRQQFESWSMALAKRFGYRVNFTTIGPCDNDLGSPTQMGIFTREVL